jgi:hypothetical protein
MKQNENIVPFFRIKKVSPTEAVIKYKGSYDRLENKLHDLEMEIDLKNDDKFYRESYGKDTLYIGNIKGYDVTVKFYECNLSGHFILANENYPKYYFGVYYKNRLVGGSLLSYFFMFTMNDETKNYLNRPQSPSKKSKKSKTNDRKEGGKEGGMVDGRKYAARYINTTLHGTYSFDMSASDKLKTDYKHYVREYLVQKKKKEANQTNQDDEFDIDENEINEYSVFFETEPEKSRHQSRDYMKSKFMEIISNPKFVEVIEIALIRREKERREDAGIDSDEEYEPPKEEDVISLIDEDALLKRFESDLEL